MQRLAGKVALVTGASSGIGLASARAMEREGAQVAICGRDMDTLSAAACSISEDVLPIKADVTVVAELNALYQQVQEWRGGLDILFANAGWSDFRPFLEIDEESFDAQIAANLKSTFFTIQRAVPILKPGASIIINSSVVAGKGWPNTNVTAAAKAGQRSLARTLSTELKSRGIRVNSVSPGPIDTDLFARHTADAGAAKKANLTAINPSGRLGRADEVAEMVVYLASSAAAWVVGADFQIDGGAGNLP